MSPHHEPGRGFVPPNRGGSPRQPHEDHRPREAKPDDVKKDVKPEGEKPVEKLQEPAKPNA